MTLPTSFDNRVAIISGAGRGLGRAYAIALAGRGAKVVVNDLGGGVDGQNGNRVAADSVVAEIRSAGGEAIANYDSVAEDLGAAAIVRTAVDCYGTVDIVINNAGIFGGNLAFHSTRLEDFRRLIGVHLFGTAALTHAAWSIMMKKRYGRVIMTASSAGLWGIENVSSYCAAKGGIIGLAKSLAHEGREHNILVNVLAPGARTRATDALLDESMARTWRAELVAPAAMYLASEACHHNGIVLAAGAGHFARVEAVQSIGKRFDPSGEVSVEDLVAHLDEIDNMHDAHFRKHGLDGL
jgi:NAD(P)-dependent dehydrogenase (short-subunit alcohol dehydrogenase family)